MDKLSIEYAKVQKLDDAFQAAVIKQFGRKNAGTMRYVASKHNAETKAASEAYHVAANEWITFMRECGTVA